MANTIYDQEADLVLNDMRELLESNREPKSKSNAATLTRSIPLRKKNKSAGIDLVHALRVQLRSLGGLDAPIYPVSTVKKVRTKGKSEPNPNSTKGKKIGLKSVSELAPAIELIPVQEIIQEENRSENQAEEKIKSMPLLEPFIAPLRAPSKRRERKPRKKRQMNARKASRIKIIKKIKPARVRVKTKPSRVRAKKKSSRAHVKNKISRARTEMRKLSGKEKLVMALMNARSRRK